MFFATFTAHDSRRSTRRQLYGVSVEVQWPMRKIRRRRGEKWSTLCENRSIRVGHPGYPSIEGAANRDIEARLMGPQGPIVR